MYRDIGWAVERLRRGKKLRRPGWNEKGMYIVLMESLDLHAFSSSVPDVARVNGRTAKHVGSHTGLVIEPYIAMMTAEGTWQPGWVCSQVDLLARDWEEVAES